MVHMLATFKRYKRKFKNGQGPTCGRCGLPRHYKSTCSASSAGRHRLECTVALEPSEASQMLAVLDPEHDVRESYAVTDELDEVRGLRSTDADSDTETHDEAA
jgi:hypothetical protein